MVATVALLVGVQQTHANNDVIATAAAVQQELLAALSTVQSDQHPWQQQQQPCPPWRLHSSTFDAVGGQVPAICTIWVTVAPSKQHAETLLLQLPELNDQLCTAAAGTVRLVVHSAQIVTPLLGVPRTVVPLDAAEQIEWLRYEYILPMDALFPATTAAAAAHPAQRSAFEFSNENFLRGSRAGPGGAAVQLSATDIETAKILKCLKKACRILTGRHDFGGAEQYGPVTRCFCRGVLPRGSGDVSPSDSDSDGGGQAALPSNMLVLSLCTTPPLLPPRLLLRLIYTAVAVARHDFEGKAHSRETDLHRPEVWRAILRGDSIYWPPAAAKVANATSGVEPVVALPFVEEGMLYIAEAAYDFVEARLSSAHGAALRLRTRPRGDDTSISSLCSVHEAATATSVAMFRSQLQHSIINASRMVARAWAPLSLIEAEPGPQAEPEPESEPKPERDTKPQCTPHEYVEALAALRNVDSEGRWPAAPPRCRRHALAIANGGGELLIFGIDPDGGSWPFSCREHSIAERAMPELAAVLRRLEVPARRAAGLDAPSGSDDSSIEGQTLSSTIVVTRHAVLKPHTLQDLFTFGTNGNKRSMNKHGSQGRTRLTAAAEQKGNSTGGAVLAADDALIVALGDFEGGELATATMDSGCTKRVSIRYSPQVVNGNSTICSSEPFSGSRYTVCWYTPRQVQHIQHVERQLTPAPRQWEAAIEAGRQAVARSRVAIVVPYRPAPGQSRERQLAIFSRTLKSFLELGCSRYPRYGVPQKLGIFVIEQSADGRRFNKGMLLNVAFDLLSREGWDSFCFSDVDVLPASFDLLPWYITPPPEGAVLHFPYWHRNVSGFGAPSGGFLHCGVAMTRGQVLATNGFPNGYWGWGGEDDALRRRVESAGLEVLRPATPQAGALRDLEFELLDRRGGGSRASDPDCAAACRCPDKILRHWQHDRGGSAPGAWREDGITQLQGGRGYTIEENWAALDTDVLKSTDGNTGCTNRADGMGTLDRTIAEGSVKQPGSGDAGIQLTVPIKRAVVHLHDISPPLPPSSNATKDSDTVGISLGDWKMPAPTVRCYLVAHPQLERGQWTDCVQPYVPRSMACHWMMDKARKHDSFSASSGTATIATPSTQEAETDTAKET